MPFVGALFRLCISGTLSLPRIVREIREELCVRDSLLPRKVSVQIHSYTLLLGLNSACIVLKPRGCKLSDDWALLVFPCSKHPWLEGTLSNAP